MTPIRFLKLIEMFLNILKGKKEKESKEGTIKVREVSPLDNVGMPNPLVNRVPELLATKVADVSPLDNVGIAIMKKLKELKEVFNIK